MIVTVRMKQEEVACNTYHSYVADIMLDSQNVLLAGLEESKASLTLLCTFELS
jgi:hypothetical protein